MHCIFFTFTENVLGGQQSIDQSYHFTSTVSGAARFSGAVETKVVSLTCNSEERKYKTVREIRLISTFEASTLHFCAIGVAFLRSFRFHEEKLHFAMNSSS